MERARSLRVSRSLLSAAALLLLGSAWYCVGARPRLVWPTPNRAYVEFGSRESFVQPAESGTVESGLFGCFRNSGTRFHEGIDLKPVSRDNSGEALDRIFAVMDGDIVYLNDVPGNSRYGRYVVVEHTNLNPAVYTLYAHLSEVSTSLRTGMAIEAGTLIGRMGRSSGGYVIPRRRAHLHFEIGLMLSDRFQRWYDSKNYDEPNRHGPWNGLNMVGFDPLEFFQDFRKGAVHQPADHIGRLPTAFTVRVNTSVIPDFIRRYPILAARPPKDDKVSAWEIDFTGFGVPKRWRPISRSRQSTAGTEKSFELVGVDGDALEKCGCREVIRHRSDHSAIGPEAMRIIEILFGENLTE